MVRYTYNQLDKVNNMPTIQVSVPDEGFELITEYATSRGVSAAEVVRQLLENSPELLAFANSKNMPITLRSTNWGGRRIPKDVQALLDRANKKNES